MIRYIILLFLSLCLSQSVYAITDPLGVPNNKYGMHIADFNDISDVATLVNSSGGDWGYITVVASDNDRDPGRWQEMFNLMRRRHLIPIVRLATHPEGATWARPNPGTFDELVAFFSKLNWPVQNRYVALYNEPNHANEWGGTIAPEEYAGYALDLAKKFKQASDDFFILPAGLDVSARSDHASMDAGEYLKRVYAARPELFSIIDGWNSHSYPNPGFSGSPFAYGRGTVRSYMWELSFLTSLGVTKRLPVFITETGWAHAEGKNTVFGLPSVETVRAHIGLAATGAWTDSRIVAITPFIFNYQDTPFDIFSWKRINGKGGFYPQYDAYAALPKHAGKPYQKEAYTIKENFIPEDLVKNTTYTFRGSLANIGQGIVDPTNYRLELRSDAPTAALLYDVIPILEPGEKGDITVYIRTPDTVGSYEMRLELARDERRFPFFSRGIRIVPPPTLTVKAQLGWRTHANEKTTTVLLYENDTLLHKFTDLPMQDNVVHVPGIPGVLPGKKYRVVLLVPSYLPVQVIEAISVGNTDVNMKRMLPVDLNNDGTLSWKDVFAIIKLRPHDIMRLFW